MEPRADAGAQETQRFPAFHIRPSSHSTPVGSLPVRCPPWLEPGLGVEFCGVSEERVGARPGLRRLVVRNKTDEALLLSDHVSS